MKVGVLGGGQLGRMLALAGHRLGIRCRFLEPGEDPPAAAVGEVLRAEYDDREALAALVAGVDVVTYEFENVPVVAVETLAPSVPVRPSPAALELAQDRLVEKDGLRALGIETADYRAVGSLDELRRALDELGPPVVVKARRMGYDGKGQSVVRSEAELTDAWARLGGAPAIAEAFVPFDRELSLVAVRGLDGEMVFYPLVENHHDEGILRTTIAPAPEVTSGLTARARGYVRALADSLDYAGVVALELFQVGDRLLANEVAPRVHNSGHWTQDGAVTCQFENHLRAVTGLRLGSAELAGERTVMTNLIGEMPDLAELLADPAAHVHLYEKAPRPGRKIGHVNVVERHV